jgi:phosphatidylethanolamine-binding protein (PEBP) family uncharacterized protein
MKSLRTTLMSGIALASVAAFMIPSAAQAADFTVSSPAVGSNSMLPATYTCDGIGTSPPIRWTGAPKKTKSFAVVMESAAPEGGFHDYWNVWNIPAKRKSLPTGNKRIGATGGNSVNRDAAYSPPCSKGPGDKVYTIHVYALSGNPKLPKANSASISRDQLLAAISKKTLKEASIDVYYSRP